MRALIPIVLLATGAVSHHGRSESTRSLDPHEWLQQLAGDWTGTSESSAAPGASPIRIEIDESIRSIGDLWIVADARTTPSGGTPVSSVMTLGYDPAEKAYVGTWIDSVQPQMWSYRGTLDPSQRILTLATRGPSLEDEQKSADYRDVIELTSADQKVLTSSVQKEDGTWFTFLRAEYRRKR